MTVSQEGLEDTLMYQRRKDSAGERGPSMAKKFLRLPSLGQALGRRHYKAEAQCAGRLS